MKRIDILKKTNRIVIKIGSSILCDSKGGFSRDAVIGVCKEILFLLKEKKEVILVSSGAIACGMDMIHVTKRPKELPLLQACAAIGQGKLMKVYEDFFVKKKYHTAQILLTQDIFYDRGRYLNTRNTFNALLELGVLPIVNENDTVVTDEIRFGDNDRLSSAVAQITGADLLINLSNVGGMLDFQKKVISEIGSESELDSLKNMVFESKAEKTVGGMKSKLDAAKILMSSGIPMIIADGKDFSILRKIFDGKNIGTLFIPFKQKASFTKTWLIYSASPKGKLILDSGAFDAVQHKGKSLLSGGISALEGHFKAGDAVRVMNEKGYEFARGLTNYSREELDKIRGRKSAEIEGVLGYKFYDEVIHRDNLVLLKDRAGEHDH
ncbi:MAG: glutamate 5-kinase [Candidatus Omnitrophica bacterium]|nr:glutamate 5-kinase [Candidatus Omnitrophota bacterium]